MIYPIDQFDTKVGRAEIAARFNNSTLTETRAGDVQIGIARNHGKITAELFNHADPEQNPWRRKLYEFAKIDDALLFVAAFNPTRYTNPEHPHCFACKNWTMYAGCSDHIVVSRADKKDIRNRDGEVFVMGKAFKIHERQRKTDCKRYRAGGE